MKTIKPDKLGVLCRTFEHGRSARFVVTTLVGFSFDAPLALMSEVDLWTIAAEELAAEGGMLDEANVKVRGELLVTGKCFVPGGIPTGVSFVRVRMAGVDKRLAVLGDRVWKRGVQTNPEPFVEMPVDWHHAFGGEGFDRNPLGKGYAPIETDDGKVHPLPNIEDPKRLIDSPSDRPRPAGFGALDFTWPQRMAKAGTYDQKWLETRAFGYAADMDPTIFNVAQEDQWLPQYFQGDEEFLVENMHPDRPRLEGRIPHLVPRTFIVQRVVGDQERFLELPMRLDTVRLFPNRAMGVLIYRGVAEVQEDDADDVETLLLACETPDHTRSVEHYRHAMEERLDKEKGALLALKDDDLMPPAEEGWVVQREPQDIQLWVKKEDFLADNLRRKQEKEYAAAKARLLELGLDPAEFDMNEPPSAGPEVDPDDVDGMLERMAEREKVAEDQQKELDEKKAEMEANVRAIFAEQGQDYDEAVAKAQKDAAGPPKFSAEKHLEYLRSMLTIAREGEAPIEELEQMVADPAYEKQLIEQEQQLMLLYRQSAHYQHPFEPLHRDDSDLFRAEIEAAHHNEIALENRDFSGADLSGMSLRGMDLRGAFLESANLTGTDLRGAKLQGAVLAHATIRRTDLSGADLSGTNLGAATFDEADLSEATLHDAILARATFRATSLRGASLNKLNLLETRFEQEVDLSDAKAEQFIAMRLDLRGARFVGADLTKAVFVETDLTEVDFTSSNLSRACFITCPTDRAIFCKATMFGTQFVHETTLEGANFAAADMTQAHLRGAPMSGATFDGACLDAADFSAGKLHDATFVRTRARQAMFVRSDLTRADMRSADLLSAIMQKAKLFGTNLQGANLFQADIAKVRVDGETNIDDTNMKRARVHPRADDGPR